MSIPVMNASPAGRGPAKTLIKKCYGDGAVWLDSSTSSRRQERRATKLLEGMASNSSCNTETKSYIPSRRMWANSAFDSEVQVERTAGGADLVHTR